jgi:hypothetical protein
MRGMRVCSLRDRTRVDGQMVGSTNGRERSTILVVILNDKIRTLVSPFLSFFFLLFFPLLEHWRIPCLPLLLLGEQLASNLLYVVITPVL